MAIAQQLADTASAPPTCSGARWARRRRRDPRKEYVPFRDGMLANGYSRRPSRRCGTSLSRSRITRSIRRIPPGTDWSPTGPPTSKANYPAEYMAALLTSVKDDKDKSAIYLNECRRMGIKVLPPDVNESDANFTATGTDIRFGLSAIRTSVETLWTRSLRRARRRAGSQTSATFSARSTVLPVTSVLWSRSSSPVHSTHSGHTRRGLAQIHAEAVDAIVETKRAESIGQYDLFGGADAAESGQSSAFGLDMTIPLGEWEKTTLLANEREMLGLYVSDHPLNGVEHTLRAATDCSIASMYTDEMTDGRVVTVGGLVTNVARKVTKRGDTWAIVSLEDLDASVEVMVFPKAYSLMGPYCSQDAVLLVRGRVDLSDESELKFIAMDITIPDLTSSHDGPVVLSVPASRIVEPVVAKLNEILETHPGTTEVRLEVKHGSRTTVMRLDDSKRVTVVRRSLPISKELLGPRAFQESRSLSRCRRDSANSTSNGGSLLG